MQKAAKPGPPAALRRLSELEIGVTLQKAADGHAAL
jgi:hypothetical protein